jgi:hypothetical protein
LTVLSVWQSEKQNKSHWWEDILDKTGSLTDRPAERTRDVTNGSNMRSDTRSQDQFWQPNSQWDATFGKVTDQRTWFGRGGNGIFGQPLVSWTCAFCKMRGQTALSILLNFVLDLIVTLLS